MEKRELTKEQIELLNKPLPAEAVTPHPTKTYLSSIKAIYVTERLNEVFGVVEWQIQTNFVAQQDKMIVCKTILTIPSYGIYYEAFGGNDNVDLGDAYKGATTDAITKIASYMGIAADVFKGLNKGTASNTKAAQPQPTQYKPAQQTTRKFIDFNDIDKLNTTEELTAFYNENVKDLPESKQKTIALERLTKRKQIVLQSA